MFTVIIVLQSSVLSVWLGLMWCAFDGRRLRRNLSQGFYLIPSTFLAARFHFVLLWLVR